MILLNFLLITDGWLRDEIGSDAFNAWCNPANGNDCGDAQFVYRPVSNISEIRNFQRRRTNAQFVFQIAPTDDLTFTLDYMLANFDRDEQRFGTGLFGVPNGDTQNTRLTANNTLASTTRPFAADALVYNNELVIEK